MTELTGNAALLAKWKRVRTPRAALQEMREHREFVGTDPYYRDLDTALWEMVDRVLGQRKSDTKLRKALRQHGEHDI